jgi:hypothetical protein
VSEDSSQPPAENETAREAWLRRRAQEQFDSWLAAEEALRAGRKSQIEEVRTEAKQRAARAHRLIEIGAIVEQYWGYPVDKDLLVGVLQRFKAEPETDQERQEREAAKGEGRRQNDKRFRRLPSEYWRVAFPKRPPVEVLAALKRVGFKYKPESQAWIGAQLPEELKPMLERVGGKVEHVVSEPRPTTSRRGRRRMAEDNGPSVQGRIEPTADTSMPPQVPARALSHSGSESDDDGIQ